MLCVLCCCCSLFKYDVLFSVGHASYLSNKITFVLDAMLGVVNLEQNNIIKLFSVMAVVLMPPTLIASIYGMNFKMMPELEWVHGYPMALVMMLAAAVLPYFLFQLEEVAVIMRDLIKVTVTELIAVKRSSSRTPELRQARLGNGTCRNSSAKI